MYTNFRLELTQPADKGIYFSVSGRSRRAGASEGRRREHGSNLAILKTASELKKMLTLNLSCRRLCKLRAKLRAVVVT